MGTREQLEALYAEYKKTVEKVIKDARPFAGFMGLGGGPKDDPCHRKFYEDACALVQQFADAGIDASEAKACVSYILGAQCREDPEGLLYWTMMAAHGAVKPLLPLLGKEDAAVLAAEYEKQVPKKVRMPLQEEILSALQGQPAKKKRWFGRG